MATAGNPQLRNIQNNNVASVVAVFLFIGSIIFLTVEFARNNNLKEKLRSERLTSESTLSEKLLLEKEILKLRAQLRSAREYSRPDRVTGTTVKKPEVADAELARFRHQTSSTPKLTRQIEELSMQMEAQDQELAICRTSFEQLEGLNNDFATTVNALQLQNKELREELEAMKPNSMQGTMTESTKKSGSLTVRAKKTKTIIVNVALPVHTENLDFRITSPSGKQLTDNEGTLSFGEVNGNKSPSRPFFVGVPSSHDPGYNQVQMTYVAKNKLEPGTYKIDVFGNSMSIGSLMLKLR